MTIETPQQLFEIYLSAVEDRVNNRPLDDVDRYVIDRVEKALIRNGALPGPHALRVFEEVLAERIDELARMNYSDHEKLKEAINEVFLATHTDELVTPSASLFRAFTSSLFGFVLVGVIAVLERDKELTTAIVGSNQGAGADFVSAVVWITAAFMASYVAGYRATGKGGLSGLFIGLYVILSLVAINLTMGIRLWEWFPIYFGLHHSWATFRETFLASGAAMWLSILVLAIPVCVYGGVLGDTKYQEIGYLEDHPRRTLFHIPWWHWIWLLLLVPGTILTNVIRSGHLFLVVLWGELHTFRFLTEDSWGFLPAVIGFIVTGYGLTNLWDALSVRTELTRRQRIGKFIGGLALLNVVMPILWAILSKMARRGSF